MIRYRILHIPSARVSQNTFGNKELAENFLIRTKDIISYYSYKYYIIYRDNNTFILTVLPDTRQNTVEIFSFSEFEIIEFLS